MYVYIEQFIDEDGSVQFFKNILTDKETAMQYLSERYTLNKSKIFQAVDEEGILQAFPGTVTRINFNDEKFVIHAVNGVLTGIVFPILDYSI
jgi:hypothetical protein